MKKIRRKIEEKLRKDLTESEILAVAALLDIEPQEIDEASKKFKKELTSKILNLATLLGITPQEK